MAGPIDADILGMLRAAKVAAMNNEEVLGIIAARDEVIARYSPMFKPSAVVEISGDALRSFFDFRNNRHWTGLARQKNRVTADMDATREALSFLLDESQPLPSRMETAAAIKGMGKAMITAILLVAYPDQYGAWNNTSEECLTELGLMPQFDRGASFGERYVAINNILCQVAAALEVDLWTLDAIWWVPSEDELAEVEAEADEDSDLPSQPLSTGRKTFALERHLHDYLFDNWDNLSIADEWEIYAIPGNEGYEFSTPVGRIDLLARHRSEPRWLVIELKRDGTSDKVVGQVLRYVGWVQENLAEAGERVEGLIVAREGDLQLYYALQATPNLSFMTYEVEFHLREDAAFEDFARP